MAETLRERIERLVGDWILTGTSLSSRSWLVNELCKLLTPTPPSREALDELLERFGDIPTPAAPASYLEHQERKRQAIMAWAQGTWTEPNKIWCRHISNEGGAWCFGKDNDYWYRPTDWDICPVKGCHTPRPQES